MAYLELVVLGEVAVADLERSLEDALGLQQEHDADGLREEVLKAAQIELSTSHFVRKTAVRQNSSINSKEQDIGLLGFRPTFVILFKLSQTIDKETTFMAINIFKYLSYTFTASVH